METLSQKFATLVAGYVKSAEKQNELVVQLLEAVKLTKHERSRQQSDIVFEGQTWRFCCWTRAYFPLKDFVLSSHTKDGYKNYTRDAQNIWSRIYRGCKKEQAALALQRATGKISQEEFDSGMEQIAARERTKDDPETYAELRKLGKQAEELIPTQEVK